MQPVSSATNMEGKEKNIVYAIAAACILGIIVIGALVLTSHTTAKGFSELYFENPDTLPRVVKVGDKIDFGFTTVSHEKKETSYDYRVTYDGQAIGSGSFSLGSAGSVQNATNRKTITVSLTPNNSSLVRIRDPVVSQSITRNNAAYGTIYSKGSQFDRINLVTSPNGYSLISGVNNTAKQIDVNTPAKFILPYKISSPLDSVGLIIFDPKLRELYNTSNSTITPEGDPYKVKQADNNGLSDLGYKIHREVWNITNDRGDIISSKKTQDTEYRYAFKKISVKESSTQSEIRGPGQPAKSAVSEGSEYEINFWILVLEESEKVQNM